MGIAQTEAERLLRLEDRLEYESLGGMGDLPTGSARILVTNQEVADALMNLLKPHSTSAGTKIESKIVPNEGWCGEDGLFVFAPAETFAVARATLPPLETRKR